MICGTTGRMITGLTKLLVHQQTELLPTVSIVFVFVEFEFNYLLTREFVCGGQKACFAIKHKPFLSKVLPHSAGTETLLIGWEPGEAHLEPTMWILLVFFLLADDFCSTSFPHSARTIS